MSNFTLKVKREELQKEISELSNIVSSIRTHFDNIEKAGRRTKNYWNGDAGEQARQGFTSYEDDITKIVQRLQNHPQNLQTITGIYLDMENKAAGGFVELKTDVIP